MAVQNTVTIQRQWSKTAGIAWFSFLNGVASATPASTDALFQFFQQLNAVINDAQNQVFTSAALTGGGVATPTMSAVRALAGGVYQLTAAGPLPALSGAAFGTGATTTFGIWWFTVDNTGTFRTYASPGNGSLTRAALTFPNPMIGPNEAVLGFLEVTATNIVFTPGTTLLNAAGVTAVLVNQLGDTGFTAFGLSEMDVA